MNVKKTIVSLLSSLLLSLNATGLTAFAETSLPDGAVKGLPERLAALDDEGNPVNSATGEYFFHVEDMEYGETYTKNIQLINLRDDASYHMYFYVEPLFKDGLIDLENWCECRFYLDDEEIYKGNVSGNGSRDLAAQHFDCGSYAPGESHTLRCEIIWNEFDVDIDVDNGWRLYDTDGEHIIIDSDGNAHIEGEVEFKWVFYAQTDPDESAPDSRGDDSDDSSRKDDGSSSSKGDDYFPPDTGGLLKDGKIWLASMGVLSLMIAVMLILIKNQNKDRKK